MPHLFPERDGIPKIIHLVYNPKRSLISPSSRATAWRLIPSLTSPWGVAVLESRRKEDPTDTEWLSPGFLSRPSYHWWPQDQHCRGWVMPNGNPSRVDNPREDRVGPHNPPPSLSLSRKRRAIGHVEPLLCSMRYTYIYIRVKILYARSTTWRSCSRDRRARSKPKFDSASVYAESFLRPIRGRELNES